MVSDESELIDDLVSQSETLFEASRSSSVSDIIGNLNLPLDELTNIFDLSQKNAKTFGLREGSLIFLYMYTCDYNQSKTEDRFSEYPYLQVRFGLESYPTQQEISYIKRHKFDLDYRLFLQDVAAEIRSQGQEHGITSKEIEMPEAEPDELRESSNTTVEKYVDRHIPRLIDTLTNDIGSAFDTGRGHNTIHSDDVAWEHQTMMSLNDRSGTRAVHRTRRKQVGNDMHGDTHTRAIKKLGTPDGFELELDGLSDSQIPNWRAISDTVKTPFNTAIDTVLDHIRDHELFTEPVAVAIDTTDWPFHVGPYKSEDEIDPGDELVEDGRGRMRAVKDDYPEMVEGGEEIGEYQYTFATLTVVGTNAPLVVGVEPVKHHSNWEGEDGISISWGEIVDELMQQAKQHLDIHLVMADKAFDNKPVSHVLEHKHDVNYLMPKEEDAEWVKEDVEEIKDDPTIDCRVVEGTSVEIDANTPYIDCEADTNVDETGHSHDQTVMYVPPNNEEWAVEKDGEKVGIFVTNRDDVSPIDALGFTQRYRKRWDIEIKYKMIKPLLPSIASKDYRMRFFSFVFSCLLYNMWRVIDHEAKVLAIEKFDHYGRGPHEDRLDTILPLDDFLSTTLIEYAKDWLDPPDLY